MNEILETEMTILTQNLTQEDLNLETKSSLKFSLQFQFLRQALVNELQIKRDSVIFSTINLQEV